MLNAAALQEVKAKGVHVLWTCGCEKELKKQSFYANDLVSLSEIESDSVIYLDYYQSDYTDEDEVKLINYWCASAIATGCIVLLNVSGCLSMPESREPVFVRFDDSRLIGTSAEFVNGELQICEREKDDKFKAIIQRHASKYAAAADRLCGSLKRAKSATSNHRP